MMRRLFTLDPDHTWPTLEKPWRARTQPGHVTDYQGEN
jgi:hypothetical protein